MLARLYMEYCPEGDLRRFSYGPGDHVGRPLGIQRSAQVLFQLGTALMYIHHGIWRNGHQLQAVSLTTTVEVRYADSWTTHLHRDIKPGNN